VAVSVLKPNTGVASSFFLAITEGQRKTRKPSRLPSPNLSLEGEALGWV